MQTATTDHQHMLLHYYEAIERASEQMLQAARDGDWNQVVKLEGACTVLIAQLKHHARAQELDEQDRRLKNRIMQRILRNDAQIRNLAEPWLENLDGVLSGRPTTMH